MVSRYLAGESSLKIAADIGCNFCSVYHELQRRGIPVREPFERHQKFGLNTDFFTSINTEASAYWLGFLAADGAMQEGFRVSLVLAIKDKAHLHKYKVALSSSKPIVDFQIKSSGFSYSRFNFRSVKVFGALVSHGVTPRKSHTLKFPTHIHPSLIHHFMRGYFDGDGSFCQNRHPSNPLIFSVIGNLAFLTEYQKVLTANCKLRSVTALSIKHRETPNIRTCRYSGLQQVWHIANFLYKDATIYLERKREIITGYNWPTNTRFQNGTAAR